MEKDILDDDDDDNDEDDGNEMTIDGVILGFH